MLQRQNFVPRLGLIFAAIRLLPDRGRTLLRYSADRHGYSRKETIAYHLNQQQVVVITQEVRCRLALLLHPGCRTTLQVNDTFIRVF